MTATSEPSTRAPAASVTLDEHTGEAPIGQSLFEWAEVAGVAVPTSCHRQGKCRECLVEIESGGECLTPPVAQERHLQGRFRLACRTRIAAPGNVRAHTLRRGSLRIETASQGLESMDEPPDSPVERHGSVVRIDGEVVGECDGPLHGLAVDVGTTTVALQLYDLETGRRIATLAFENPQRFGGSDVLSRIHYDATYRGRLLQRTLLGHLARSIADLPVPAESIFEVVVAGNPTMRDLLFGLDVQELGVLPYRSSTEAAWREGRATTTSLARRARLLRLPLPSRARVYGLPLVGSHVGADAAACLAATGLGERDELCALLDIGTNTEVFLGNRHRLLAASCPAGPAFEGGGVGCGMPALDGAIERVRLDADGRAATQVIGATTPLGVCGSGLVDLLSELRRTGHMNEQGRFAEPDEPFVIDGQRGLSLSEADVNELAQAKGANAAGLRVLADEYGTTLERIDRVYLAGGFARHIDVEAACRIGLVPDLPRDRIVKVGNAALAGAGRVLLSRRRRAALETLVQRIELVRLEASPHFFDYFAQGCQFAPVGSAA